MSKMTRSLLLLYSSVVEQTDDCVVITDREGVIEYINPSFERQTGYSKEEVLGNTPRILKSGRHTDDFYGHLWDTILAGNVFRGVFINKKKSGDLYYAEMTITPLKNKKKTITHFVATAKDITERKRAEEEHIQLVREQAARAEAEALSQRTVFLASASALLSSSLDYPTTLSNLAHLAVPYLADLCMVDIIEDKSIRLLAVAHKDASKEDLVREIRRKYPPGQDGSHPVMKVILNGQPELLSEFPSSLIEEIAHDSHHLKILHELCLKSAMIVPLISRGRALGAITFVSSESDRRYGQDDLTLAEDLGRRSALAIDNALLYRKVQETNRDLEEKIRELDDFAHMVAHDLKEPLRGIEAFSNFLLEDYANILDDEGRRSLNFLEGSANRMKALVHDLLTLASISKKGPNIQEIDLNQILKQVQDELAFSIRQKGAEIMVRSSLPTILCDPIHIREVFKNLVSNAIKFNVREKPLVEILAREDETLHLISVRDNGIGIDPNCADRIFRLFERLHPREEFDGTGVGLAICKKVIERYGGKIWVETLPGKGSTFFFNLPRSLC